MNIMGILLLSILIPSTAAEQVSVPLADIRTPHQIAVDGNDLYVFEESDYSLHVYSISPFDLKWRTGRKGDGPTDFKYLPLLSVQPEGLTCSDFTKILWFSRTGALLKIKPFAEFPDFDINSEMILVPFREKFLRITADHGTLKRHVILLDSGFRTIRELYEGPFVWRSDAPISYRTDTVCRGDLVFVSDTQKGFYFSIFDLQGALVRTIDISNEVEKIPGFPLLHQFCVSDGRIYATTYKKKDNLTEMIVLDFNGRILRRIFIPLRPLPKRGVVRSDLYTVDRDQLYELIPGQDDGTWMLRITDLGSIR